MAATTEAFYRMNKFQSEFDSNIKITFGCLEKLRSIGPRRSGKSINLPTGGEPWGNSILIRDPIQPASSAIRFFSTMGIVRVIAALEDYLQTLEDDFKRTSFLRDSDRKLDRPDPKNEWAGLKAVNTACDMGISSKIIEEYLPLYKYFTNARHCIVHRNGRASDDMLNISASQGVADCHARWKTKSGKPLPALPAICNGKEISWLPRHAILSMSVCYKIASILDAEAIKIMGDKGIIYMAAHYFILNGEKIETESRKSPDVLIKTAIHNRYREKDISRSVIIKELKEMNKWEDCYAAFKKIPGAIF